jgi:hypothetical protein
MKNFDKRKVPLGTYHLLHELGILPEKRTRDRIVEETKELFKLMVEENSKTSFLAVSGYGDSKFWNPLEKEIMSAISHGMKFFHCLGPVICTDEDGKHASIEAYREYPKDVELWLCRTRSLYHLKIFTGMKNNSLFFHVHGECHHKPLASDREIYYISLLSNYDPNLVSKMKYFSDVLGSYETLKVIRDKVTDIKRIPVATRYQLSKAYKNGIEYGKDITLMSSKEILDLLHSKPL